MSTFRTLIAFLCCSSLAWGADGAKLRTITGKAYEGEVVGISETEVKLRGKDGPVTVPIREVLDLELPTSAAAPETKYTDVELNDGSTLHCIQFALLGNQVEVKLVGGLDLKFPLASVSSILKDAQDAKVREEWQEALGKRGNSDLMVIRRADGSPNNFEGTLGNADAKGEKIEFETISGTKARPELARIHAMSFLRKPDPNAPAPVCKLHDTSRNVLVVAKVALDAKGFAVTTVSGVKLELPRESVARLDYSKGKLTFLSDLEPVKAIQRSTTGWVENYGRDKNLDRGPLRLGKDTFAKGLALHGYTELVYDLGGQYKEFKAVLGVDPTVPTIGGDNAVKVTIEGDGRELFAQEVKRKDDPRPLALDVKNVKQIRIVVAPSGLLDLGGHVNFGDAKVSK